MVKNKEGKTSTSTYIFHNRLLATRKNKKEASFYHKEKETSLSGLRKLLFVSVYQVNQTELKSLFVCFLPFFFNIFAYDTRTASRKRESYQQDWLLAHLFGVFSYACACLAVSDPNRFASRHLPYPPTQPPPPPPPAHKTFIRAQPCAARDVCVNKSVEVSD